MHDTADALGWVWGGVLTLGSAEDQVEHAVCSITAVEAHHHLAAPGHAICLPASIMRSLIPPINRLFIKSLCMQRQHSFLLLVMLSDSLHAHHQPFTHLINHLFDHQAFVHAKAAQLLLLVMLSVSLHAQHQSNHSHITFPPVVPCLRPKARDLLLLQT